MMSLIWMTTESMKFSDIESIKNLFESTKRACLVKCLNKTSRNKTMAQLIIYIYHTIKQIFNNT